MKFKHHNSSQLYFITTSKILFKHDQHSSLTLLACPQSQVQLDHLKIKHFNSEITQ